MTPQLSAIFFFVHIFHTPVPQLLIAYRANVRPRQPAMCVMRRRRRRHLSFATVTALAFLVFASASAIGLNQTRKLGSGVREQREEAKAKGARDWEVSGRVMTRRGLRGPGSFPPTCRSKCGRCSPCKPVHVPIQPGLSMPLEYYPEAWRCECAHKLFMP